MMTHEQQTRSQIPKHLQHTAATVTSLADV